MLKNPMQINNKHKKYKHKVIKMFNSYDLYKSIFNKQ